MEQRVHDDANPGPVRRHWYESKPPAARRSTGSSAPRRLACRRARLPRDQVRLPRSRHVLAAYTWLARVAQVEAARDRPELEPALLGDERPLQRRRAAAAFARKTRRRAIRRLRSPQPRRPPPRQRGVVSRVPRTASPTSTRRRIPRRAPGSKPLGSPFNVAALAGSTGLNSRADPQLRLNEHRDGYVPGSRRPSRACARSSASETCPVSRARSLAVNRRGRGRIRRAPPPTPRATRRRTARQRIVAPRHEAPRVFTPAIRRSSDCDDE